MERRVLVEASLLVSLAFGNAGCESNGTTSRAGVNNSAGGAATIGTSAGGTSSLGGTVGTSITSTGGTSNLGGAETGGATWGGGDDATGGSGGNATGACPWRTNWNVETVTTPFAAPNQSLVFSSPSIPCKIFRIIDYGAKPGGASSNTSAFEQAVAAASAANGGVVDVPAGNWLTGAIRLASSIELHLEAGATILFSQQTSDYLPAVLTRWEGLDVMNWSPFIYARDAHDVAITGPGAGDFTGVLDGNGSSWWSWKLPSSTEDQRIYNYYVGKLRPDGTLPNPLPTPPISAVVNGLRPSMVECHTCSNFLIDGIRTQNSAYWTLHPLYSKNVVIRNANLTSNAAGTNGDGVDVDSCQDVLIENTSFATSDDIISIKSGLNEDGIAVGKPSERIVIRNISATSGHALSIGSEMSGGINNVYVTADTTNALNSMSNLLRVKTLPGRGGTMQNIWFECVSGSNWSSNAIELNSNYGSSTIDPHNPALLPYVSNLTIRNVSGSSQIAPALNIIGTTQAPFSNILLDTVTLTGITPNGCSAASGVTLANSSISGITGTSLSCP